MLISELEKERQRAAVIDKAAHLSDAILGENLVKNLDPVKAQCFADAVQGATLILCRGGGVHENFIAVPDVDQAQKLVSFFREQGSVLTEGVHPVHSGGRYVGTNVTVISVPDLVAEEVKAFNKEGIIDVPVKQVGGKHELDIAVREAGKSSQGVTM